jgi:hypothetical protein
VDQPSCPVRERAGAGGGSNASQLTIALLEHVDVRLKALNDLTSEAVHSTVIDAEVDQCVVQTYLAIGDIVRLADDR